MRRELATMASLQDWAMGTASHEGHEESMKGHEVGSGTVGGLCPRFRRACAGCLGRAGSSRDDTKSTKIARGTATALMGISALRYVRRDAHRCFQGAVAPVLAALPSCPSRDLRVLREFPTPDFEEHACRSTRTDPAAEMPIKCRSSWPFVDLHVLHEMLLALRPAR